MATRVIDKDQRVYTLERPEFLPPLLREGLRDFYLADHPHIKITLDPNKGEVTLSDVEATNVFYSTSLFGDLTFSVAAGLWLYAKCVLLQSLADLANDDGIKNIILKRHWDEADRKWINQNEGTVNATLVMLMRLPRPAFSFFRRVEVQTLTPLQDKLAQQLKTIGIDQIKSLTQVEQILLDSGVIKKMTLSSHS